MKKKSMVFDIVYSPKKLCFSEITKDENQIYKWNKNEHNASIKTLVIEKEINNQKGRVERAL